MPAALYAAAASARAALYDRKLLPVARLPVAVLSVGNLSVGGTGKTPMVALLVRLLRARGRRPGILSRGYGAPAGEANDEARALDALLPGVPHVQDPDRVRGGRALVERHGADTLVLDDGFQHRRLHRDLDLVLVDATRPWGLPAAREGAEPVAACLPRGFLREPPRALRRADAVVMTRCDQVPAAALERLRAQLRELAPGAALLEAEHRARGLAGMQNQPAMGLDCLQGREVTLVSGIGNPEAFERTALGLGARVREHRRFSDHHDYSAGDLAGLEGRTLLTTSKDAVKLRGLAPGALVLEVECVLRSGAPVLEALLDSLVQPEVALHG